MVKAIGFCFILFVFIHSPHYPLYAQEVDSSDDSSSVRRTDGVQDSKGSGVSETMNRVENLPVSAKGARVALIEESLTSDPGLKPGIREHLQTESDLSSTESRVILDYRDQTSDGFSRTRRLGLGVDIDEYFSGLALSFDYPIEFHLARLIHAQLILDFTSVDSEGTRLLISRRLLSVLARDYIESEFQIYYGFGGGIGQNELTYTNINTDQRYQATGLGVFIQAEIGIEREWFFRKKKKLFLSAAFQPALFLMYNSGYDETRISDLTNHRRIVNSGWSAARRITPITFLVAFEF